jgi:hypothetical protein
MVAFTKRSTAYELIFWNQEYDGHGRFYWLRPSSDLGFICGAIGAGVIMSHPLQARQFWRWPIRGDTSFPRLCMNSVGKAAMDMLARYVVSLKIPGIMEGTGKPEYAINV